MRRNTVELMPEVTVFLCHRAAVGSISQRTNGVPEAAIPGERRLGRTSADPVIEAGKIPLGAGHDLNRIVHDRLRIRRRRPRRRALFLAWTRPVPDEFLRERRRGRRCRATVDRLRHPGRWPRLGSGLLSILAGLTGGAGRGTLEVCLSGYAENRNPM